MIIKRHSIFHVCMYVLMLAVGLLLGIAIASKIHFETKLTLDGITTSVVSFAAIMAATVILPLRIQPLLQKFNGMNNVAQEDIRRLLRYIDTLAELHRVIYESKSKVTAEERKKILDSQTKILSIAAIILKQSSKLAALSDFKSEIYEPLSNTKNGVAEKVYPGMKIEEDLYLEIKGDLDKITYRLIELRYELN